MNAVRLMEDDLLNGVVFQECGAGSGGLYSKVCGNQVDKK